MLSRNSPIVFQEISLLLCRKFPPGLWEISSLSSRKFHQPELMHAPETMTGVYGTSPRMYLRAVNTTKPKQTGTIRAMVRAGARDRADMGQGTTEKGLRQVEDPVLEGPGRMR